MKKARTPIRGKQATQTKALNWKTLSLKGSQGRAKLIGKEGLGARRLGYKLGKVEPKGRRDDAFVVDLWCTD